MRSRLTSRRSTAQQALALRATFPTSRITLKPKRLTWIGKLRPTALSIEYTVKITYSMGESPKVYVLDPPLEPPPGGRLQHVYPGKRLCLHYPEQWSSDLFIAQTIVPWASEWLLHYELLKATGKWLGGGHEPTASSVSSSKSE